MDSADVESVIRPIVVFLSYTWAVAQDVFYKIPGSHVIARYVRSSHQNDPGRTILELILIIFAIRTLLQSRTRADRSGKSFVQYTEEVRLLLSLDKRFRSDLLIDILF